MTYFTFDKVIYVFASEMSAITKLSVLGKVYGGGITIKISIILVIFYFLLSIIFIVHTHNTWYSWFD